MNRPLIGILLAVLILGGGAAFYFQHQETERLKAENANAAAAMEKRLRESEIQAAKAREATQANAAAAETARQEAEAKTAKLEASLSKAKEKINTPISETKSLCSGDQTVEAGKFKTATFTVTQAMINPMVEGRFQVSGGMNNDIEAVIAEEREYENWKNGNRVDGAKIFYNSGRKTTGEINARGMPPGNYVLAFSNKFAVMLPKTVSCQINLHYEIQR